MSKQSKYVAKPADEHGYVTYTKQENAVWHDLIVRQMRTIVGRACPEFMQGLNILNFPMDKIPQCPDINRALHKATGWSVKPVAALIPIEEFFSLLANCQFPAATFIRSREELDYLQEPDLFHEFFGHCPMLTQPAYANFAQNYGKLALQASPKERQYLGRLYWYTVEFGLIQTDQGMRIYGGGILSSDEETVYALSDKPLRVALDPLVALRTPYRIDILQPQYFVIEDYQQLYDLLAIDLLALVRQAITLGDFPARFPPKSEPDMAAC